MDREVARVREKQTEIENTRKVEVVNASKKGDLVNEDAISLIHHTKVVRPLLHYVLGRSDSGRNERDRE